LKSLPDFCVPLGGGTGWFFEGMLCWGLLFGFTVLVNPTPGLAINFGPGTLIVYRVNHPKRKL